VDITWAGAAFGDSNGNEEKSDGTLEGQNDSRQGPEEADGCRCETPSQEQGKRQVNKQQTAMATYPYWCEVIMNDGKQCREPAGFQHAKGFLVCGSCNKSKDIEGPERAFGMQFQLSYFIHMRSEVTRVIKGLKK